jgi:hypothetical protein
VSPQIIANLDSMSAQGLLLDMTEFVSNCVSFYGKDVLLGSRLPWLSQLTFPGNTSMVESAMLVARLNAAQSVFISYNSGPWSALKSWEKATPSPNELAILLDGEGSSGLPYRSSSDGPRVGSLSTLWEDRERAPLFNTLVDIIAQAWQITPTDLVKQDGWVHTTTKIEGRFRRS